jgi:hypothetical protein
LIDTETVLVLGAGASVPFGFPTGAELRQKLCLEMRAGHSIHELLRDSGQDTSLIGRLCEEFERSGINSIDAFIAFRPEYQKLGELAIAAALVPLEDYSKLMNVGGKQGNSDWYQLLWNEMLAGVSEPKDVLQNKVRFITFNYDRSLEQYLLYAIRHTFELDQNAAFDVLRQIPIQHVYGSLGNYHPEDGFRYERYKKSALLEVLSNATQTIKTVPAVRGPIDPISVEWLSKAQRVFVMGFGFDATNCSRIGLTEACSLSSRKTTPREIFASAYHLTDAEKRWCEANACTPGSGGLIWTNGDCLALLRDRRDKLSP